MDVQVNWEGDGPVAPARAGPAADEGAARAERLAAVGATAAGVAHELNNALGIVTLWVERLLARTPPGDPRRRGLEVVDQEAERMVGLVADMLGAARARCEMPSAVDVAREAARAIELMAHRLAGAGVRAVPEFAPDAPPVAADRPQLRQVLLNLLGNAVDAMPQGGRVDVRVYRDERAGGRPAVVLEVADTGAGIPPDVLPRVTEAFFTTKGEGKGTGLGLAICKRIVDQHGGELAIASRVGTGTTVTVTLPVSPQSSTDDRGRRGGCSTNGAGARRRPVPAAG